ncbi:hypothetical protein [Mobiluncus mulieris]|uniref:Uncharacterized protein n=1 Tax=Mobiluncus mulieris TaxID=2052 RepID=A0A7Y0US90_9ACTO|nr:hypothetical protein [Mobiluncus mulieris]NMX02793.1 hypothetical protein [Mobiluncus mulieris]
MFSLSFGRRGLAVALGAGLAISLTGVVGASAAPVSTPVQIAPIPTVAATAGLGSL